MIILLLLQILIIILIYDLFIFIHSVFYKFKINNLLESINTKEDLLYMRSMDFQNVIAEVFKRKGNKVKITDKCGEYGNGFIINDLKYAEIWKHAINHTIDVEAGMKLAHLMQINSISRGILITLGDYKQSTKKFCHKSVIECINGDQLLEMCKEVQKRREVLQTND